MLSNNDLKVEQQNNQIDELDFIQRKFNPQSIKSSISQWDKLRRNLALKHHPVKELKLFTTTRKIFDKKIRPFANDLKSFLKKLTESPLGKKEPLHLDQIIFYQNKLLRHFNFDVDTIIFDVQKIIYEHQKYVKLHKTHKNYSKPIISEQQVSALELLIDRFKILHAKLHNDDKIINDCTKKLLNEYQDYSGYVRRSEFKSTRDVKEELQKLQKFFKYTEKDIDAQFKIDRQEKEKDEKYIGDVIKDTVGAASSFFLGPLGFRIAEVGFDMLALMANIAAARVATFLSDDGAKQVIAEAFASAVENDMSYGSGDKDLSNFADQIDKLTLVLHKAVLSEKSIQRQAESAREAIFKECDQTRETLGRDELEHRILEKVKKVITDALDGYDKDVEKVMKKMLGKKNKGMFFSSSQIIAPLYSLANKMTLGDLIFNQHPDFAENPQESMLLCIPKIFQQLHNREGDEKIIEYVMKLENTWCSKDQLKKFGFDKEKGIFYLQTKLQHGKTNIEFGNQRKNTAMALLVIFKMFECYCKTIIPEMMDPENQAKAIIAIASLGNRISEFSKTYPNILFEIFKSIQPFNEMLSDPEVIKALKNQLTLTNCQDHQLYSKDIAGFLHLNQLKSKDFQIAMGIYAACHKEKQQIALTYSQLITPSQELNKKITILSEQLTVKFKRRKILRDLLKHDATKKSLLGKYKPFDEHIKELNNINEEINSIKQQRFNLEKDAKNQESKIENLQKSCHFYGIKNGLINTSNIKDIDKISDNSLQLLAAFNNVLFNAINHDEKSSNSIKTLLSKYKSLFEAQTKLKELFKNTPLLNSTNPLHAKAKQELFDRIIEDNYQFMAGIHFSTSLKADTKPRANTAYAHAVPLRVMEVDGILKKLTEDSKDKYCLNTTIFPWDDHKQREILKKSKEFKLLFVPIVNPFSKHWSLIEVKNINNNIQINYIHCSPLNLEEKNKIINRIQQQFHDFTSLADDKIAVTTTYTKQQPIIYSPESDISANFAIENIINNDAFKIPSKDEAIVIRKNHISILMNDTSKIPELKH